MPPKMKISINLGGAAAPQANAPLEVAAETGSSIKRERDDEAPESANVKRSRQESLHAVAVKAEPKSEDEMGAPLVEAESCSVAELKFELPWHVQAANLLNFMDSHDKFEFFRHAVHFGGEEGHSIARVRAQLDSGVHASFDSFLSSLMLVYRNAERHHGTDVHRQSVKLLHLLQNEIQSISHALVPAVKEEPVTNQQSAGSDNDENSDDDAPLVDSHYVTKEEIKDELSYIKECGFSDDDDDAEQPRTSRRSNFQDKYENHPDHAHRPFWVCLMVCRC